MKNLPLTARWLGAAGVLPFLLGCALVLIAGDEWAAWALAGLRSYALAIVCFLCGAWWGIALIRREPALLVVSNVVVVAAWLAVLLLETAAALLVLAALLVFTSVLEGRHPAFMPQPSYYRRMRLRLTALASGSLLLAALLG